MPWPFNPTMTTRDDSSARCWPVRARWTRPSWNSTKPLRRAHSSGELQCAGTQHVCCGAISGSQGRISTRHRTAARQRAGVSAARHRVAASRRQRGRAAELPESGGHSAHGSAVSNMGSLYYERKEYTRAVEAYRQAIALRPNSSATYRNLGDALRKLGQAAEARTAYLAAMRLSEGDLKVNPNDARTIASLACTCKKRARLNRHEPGSTKRLRKHPAMSKCYSRRPRSTPWPAGPIRHWRRCAPPSRADTVGRELPTRKIYQPERSRDVSGTGRTQ